MMMTTKSPSLYFLREFHIMNVNRSMHDQGGYALLAALVVLIAVSAMAGAAVLIGGNANLINAYSERQAEFEAAAEAGIEEARALLNADPSRYPASGFDTLELRVPVLDANGNEIPNLRRSTFAGPTGVTTGEFGVMGSIVSVVEDAAGNRVVRRGEIIQESFAKFAYFTDVEPDNIGFGGGDQIFGPVHSNDDIMVYESGATFESEVTTNGTVRGEEYGTFEGGLVKSAPRIELPTTRELDVLKGYADEGGTAFKSSTGGPADRARMRIEFLTITTGEDANGNPIRHGFFKVYKAKKNDASGRKWVVAAVDSLPELQKSENCGFWIREDDDDALEFKTAEDMGLDEISDAIAASALPRCYLGGSDSIFGEFEDEDDHGEWLKWEGEWGERMPDAIEDRDDKEYLFPLQHAFNPEFEGVIHIEGKVAISGEVRGRVTVAATDNIIIADDLRYATDRGAEIACGDASSDMVGLFSAKDIVVAYNTLNSPQWVDNRYETLDDTPEEIVHAVILALESFRVGNYANSATYNKLTVDSYNAGLTRDEACEGREWGRGCLYLTGGIIQRERGPVGTILSQGYVGGTGYLKRYSYDQCAGTHPPPYFPTTNHFIRWRNYQVDPVGFDVATYFDDLTAGS